jgi:Domain of unknown function (DUF5668)
MNPYLFIHRIKGPSMLLVFGVTALLNEWDIVSYGRSWPLYLIVLGVLQLAERAALAQWQQTQYAQGQYPSQYATQTVTPPATSSALAVTPHDLPYGGTGNSDEGR